jgi:hypothetical protein
MKRVMICLFYGICFECLSLVAFVIGGEVDSISIKIISIVCWFLGMSSAIWWSVGSLQNKTKISLFCIVMATVFVFFYNFLGFEFYPGLIKDIKPFSGEHFVVLGKMFAFLYIVHCLFGLLFFFVKKSRIGFY